MTEIKNETGTKKKLIIPVVVLMLLAVGLTGAAYAYSSTLTVNSNTVDSDVLSVDLATPNAANDVTSKQTIITYTDNFGYTASGTPVVWTKSDRIDYELKATVNVATLKVQFHGDAAWTKIVVDSTDLASKSLTSDKTLGQLYDLKYVVKNAAGNETLIGATALGTSVAKGELTIDTTYTVVIVATAITSPEDLTTGTAYDYADVSTGHDAAYYQRLVNAMTFSVTVEANNDA